MLPIESDSPSLKPRNSKIDSVGSGWKSSGEIKLDISGTLSASQSWTKDFEPYLRLPQCCAKTARRASGWDGLREIGKIQVVGCTVIPESIHQHDARKSRMILGCGLDLSLVLFVNF